jgi:hypothetical protein
MVQEKDSMNPTSKNSVSRRFARLPLQKARMGILWVAFCIAQAGFPPAFAAPPVIAPSTSLQSKAVFLAKSAFFGVTASGDAPLLYQWRFDGQDLLNQTNKTLSITAAQPTDEGDYTVRVTNGDGAVISDSARLWVVPPSTKFIKGNFTNEAGLRLPYFYVVPTDYDPARTYPLVCLFHGAPGGEATFPGFSAAYAWTLIFASYGQQAADPAILVWPSRRAGDDSWTDQYLRQVSGLLDKLVAEFNVDTNRVYVGGASEGVHAAWDLIGMRPGFFAGAGLAAGWQASTRTAAIKDMPLWAWCAADDGLVADTRTWVRALRQAGGNPIYTEYKTGGHYDGIGMGLCNPAMVNWLLAQRRGSPSTVEPLLRITHPTSEAVPTTGALTLDVSGSAEALGQNITLVTWTNAANEATGVASGTNLWSAARIPLLADKTNLVIVTATTTSWAPGYGGNTTFNNSLAVVCSPIRATLVLQGSAAVLNWSGGAAPFQVQRATDLSIGDWTEILTNALPPLTLPVERETEFYRVVGH